MSCGILIQVRSDSTRFPNKVFEIIENQSMLWHIIERCKWMQLPIIVTTSHNSNDDKIEEIAKICNVECFRGSKDDVLDRFYNAAKKYSLDYIFRITGDCPLIDPKQSIKVLEELLANNEDYVSLDDKTYPDGLDTEVFTFIALEKAWKNAKLKSEREHVTPFLYNSNNNFKIKKISYKKNYSNLRWTVDYDDDLEFVRKIYSYLYGKQIFFMEDILELLEKYPELKKINSSHSRNEGYAKSLDEDKII